MENKKPVYSYWDGTDFCVEFDDGTFARYPNFAKDSDMLDREEHDYEEG